MNITDHSKKYILQQSMHQFKILYLVFILCWCCSSLKGDETVAHKSKNIFKRSSRASLDCDQYVNDFDVLSNFPFTVGLNYKLQGPDKSTAILDSNKVTVVMIQLRQAGAIVPEIVFCLKNLQALDIMNMFFADGIVPDSLSNLQQLHSLSMTNTPISKMTDNLGALKNLESLSLDKCSLTHLPNLSGLLKLSRVSLPNNQLSKLEGLQKVASLSLYKNLFTEIPTLAVPDALRRLDMNFNPVTDMSIVLSFSNVTEIRLSETKISVIPPEIHELEFLYFLDLAATRITHVPRTLLAMPKLQYLVVQRNPIPQEEVAEIKMELIQQQSKVTLLI